MAGEHWSDDDLMAGLYGIGPPDKHLSMCEECRARWEIIRSRREQLLARDAAVSQEFLARQRQSIYQRLDARPLWLNFRFASVLAALLLIFVIVSIFRSAHHTQPFDAMSDAEVFEDIYNIASSVEPSAVEPVHSLFEVEQ